MRQVLPRLMREFVATRRGLMLVKDSKGLAGLTIGN